MLFKTNATQIDQWNQVHHEKKYTIEKLILITISIIYFMDFIIDTLLFTVEPPYWGFSLLWLSIYIFFWIIPIWYLWKKWLLGIMKIFTIIWINIILLSAFFYLTETPYVMQIRQEPSLRAAEKVKNLDKKLFEYNQEHHWSIK